jgi:hypothetical protein
MSEIVDKKELRIAEDLYDVYIAGEFSRAILES